MALNTSSYIPLKDPNSPKYNEPAYMHYINAMRQQFQACHPTAPYDRLPTFTFSMYANLPLVEQDIWKARAAANKERYLLELATYVPPIIRKDSPSLNGHNGPSLSSSPKCNQSSKQRTQTSP
jgi:hypothetical protein